MSPSTSRVRWPAVCRARAVLLAVLVLPSPGTELRHHEDLELAVDVDELQVGAQDPERLDAGRVAAGGR